jgi:hypothetical protein
MESANQPSSVERHIPNPQLPIGYLLYQQGVLEFMPYSGEELVDCFRPLPSPPQKETKIEVSKAGRPIKTYRNE